MNYKNLIIISFIVLLTGCKGYSSKENSINHLSILKYNNVGFALIYSDSLRIEKKISKKIDNRSLHIFHKTLKKNSFVKITNPINGKTIIAEVISNNVKFP